MKIDEIKIHVGKEKDFKTDPREGFPNRMMYEEGKIVVRRGKDIKEYPLRIGEAAYSMWKGRFLTKGTSMEPGPVLELLAQSGPETRDEMNAFAKDLGLCVQWLNTIKEDTRYSRIPPKTIGDHYRLENIGIRIERTFTNNTKITIE